MAAYTNSVYTIERAFNDFGPRVTNVGYVGKTEVTILDNLYRISQLLHGRILTSASVSGGFKVYVPKLHLKDLILAYQTLSPYKLSTDLDPLIQSLRSLFQSSTVDVEIGLDSRIILQMITVHNTISCNLKGIWEGVVGLRLISQSGFNKDVSIDGSQQTLDTMLSRFSESQSQIIKREMDRAGQLAGIKAPRQVEMRDMVSDLIFSRKDSYVTLHQLFHTTEQQRKVLREFRTDILFCPVDRYKELDAGLGIETLITVVKTGNGADEIATITPKGFEFAEFEVRNLSLESITITVAGSIGSGRYQLEPHQDIKVFGTSVSFPSSKEGFLLITVTSDIREYVGSGTSIVTLALEGKLKENPQMLNLFFQIIKPILPYLSSVVRKIHGSELLQVCISKLGTGAKNVFDNLKPGYIYSGWLLSDPASSLDRMVYVYILTMMLPEFLLDPTLRFSDASGTPPYIHEYSLFTQGLRKMYE